MYRRGAVEAQTAAVRGALALAAPPGGTLLVAALEGPAVVERAGDRAELLPYDAALLTGPLDCRIRTAGRAAVVRFAPAPAPAPARAPDQL